MPNVSESIEIDASSEVVFDLIHNYDVRLKWDTMLAEARLLDQADQAGAGVRTRCVGTWKCFWIPVESTYIAFRRPQVAAVKMDNQPWFFDQFAASIRHESLSENRSTVSYHSNFTAKPSWLRGLLEPIMKQFLRREIRHRLKALKEFAESQ